MSSNEIAEFVCLWGMLVPMAIGFWGFILWALAEWISDIKYNYQLRKERKRRDEEWRKKYGNT